MGTKKTRKKTRTAAKKAPEAKLVPVMFVGVRGCGITTLVRALAPDAAEHRVHLNEQGAYVLTAKADAGDAAGSSVTARIVTLGGVAVALHDVPGDGRTSDTKDFNEQRFARLLNALAAAQVIVHVIDAADPEAERMGGRLDNWIYGSWNDDHAAVLTVFTKTDAVRDPAVLAALRGAWPDALDVNPTRTDTLDALREAIATAATTKRTPPKPPEGIAARRLLDLQLDLVARTTALNFDGPAYADELRTMLDTRTLRGVVFLREGMGAYEGRALERETDGLRFLGRLHEDVWDADTMHLRTSTPALARRLATRLTRAMGAIEAAVVGDDIVRARWDMADLDGVSTPGAPTVQDIQMEFIRRGSFNAFRGDRVAASLLAHRALWRAVAFGRLRTQIKVDGKLQDSGAWLNPVTEIADDIWNADELWVVVPDAAAAERIRFLGEVHWFADNIVTLEGDEARRVANVSAPAMVVELWWD